MRKLLLSIVAALFATGSAAETPPPPRLVVAIAVDQFSADLFDEYRGEFTGGLARLSREGIVFHNGYQSHAATETCPGHSTILTGDHPARTGIIANDWYLPASARGRTAIYCAEDESKGTRDAYVVSAVHLRVATLGDRLKAANPRSQSVAVAGKDRAAVMMGGHRPDVRWYYRDGRFESDLPGQPSTPAEIAVNRDVAAQIAAGVPPLPIPVSCAARDRATELPGGRTVGTGRLANGPGASDYPYGPALDRETLALASGLVDERQLGRDGAPDVLAISLSATDYVGHRYGTEGLEMCLQLHALDHALGQFFAGLDRRGLDYVVVLTADHGGTDIPERLRSSDPRAADDGRAVAPEGRRPHCKGPAPAHQPAHRRRQRRLSRRRPRPGDSASEFSKWRPRPIAPIRRSRRSSPRHSCKPCRSRPATRSPGPWSSGRAPRSIGSAPAT